MKINNFNNCNNNLIKKILKINNNNKIFKIIRNLI